MSAEPPATFLQTDVGAWQRILATEITADFRNATVRDVISYIGRQSQANIVLSLTAPQPARRQLPGSSSTAKDLPTLTDHFKRVPLRSVFYRLSQDTGLSVEWVYENRFPRAIRIRNK